MAIICRCAESLYLRQRMIPIPRQHSCEYVRRRNALITDALNRASIIAMHKKHKGVPFTTLYMMEMDKLARERIPASVLEHDEIIGEHIHEINMQTKHCIGCHQSLVELLTTSGKGQALPLT